MLKCATCGIKFYQESATTMIFAKFFKYKNSFKIKPNLEIAFKISNHVQEARICS